MEKLCSPWAGFFLPESPAAFLPSGVSACADVMTPRARSPAPAELGAGTEPGVLADPECEASARLAPFLWRALPAGSAPAARSSAGRSQGGRALLPCARVAAAAAAPRNPPGPLRSSLRREAGAFGRRRRRRRRRRREGRWRPWSSSGSQRLSITPPSPLWWITTSALAATSAPCRRTSSSTCTTRHLLHHCFQALMDHGVKVASVLAYSFSRRCSYIAESDAAVKEKAIQVGFVLGGFLSDAGWYSDAEKVFLSCLQLCTLHDEMPHWFRAVECCVRLLHVRNGNCKYHLGEETFKLAQTYMDKLSKHGQQANKAALYGELCALLFAKSHYDEAYKWCIEAMKEITTSLPVKVVVDVLRQASKAALDIRQSVFGGKNIHVATAHEDLAYSSYVHQYSSGKFDNALFHAERAIGIITHILPEDHLLLASSKRVKALILEEIAIDCHNKETEQRLLQEAHDLHLSSLQLAKKAFGEFNVQTAKHYGNLGRLYQSMRKFKEAEEMHIKAIQIKEQLLGQEDYEVALSVGHLASLYNYDMNQYENAEKLYLRSIAIGKKLFGEGYSGLEYDYRGLIKLYNSIGNYEKVFEYHNVLSNWNRLRDRQYSVTDALEDVNTSPQSTEEVVQSFLTAQNVEGPSC
uniref:Amyloid beta protein binding protein 2 n=1 Tax=Bos indicus x Bos taurus TaxID=30522 RepID=A0A4W2DUG2_BOBOX